MICKRCEADLPEDEFPKDRSRPSGRFPYCKSCNVRHVQIWYEQNKERAKANALESYRRGIETGRSRRNKLLSRYNLTIERYEELLEQQGYVCAVCANPPIKDFLDVDHDHACCPGNRSCGECVRGLLCELCNRAAGQVKDDADIALALFVYLAKARGDFRQGWDAVLSEASHG